MTEKKFASQADMEQKKITFAKLSEHAYAFTAEGDPNTGVIIGDDCVMVLDTQATPVMAQLVIDQIRTVTDKPIKYVVLTHYHAVRVLGATGYNPEHIISSMDTRDLIVERGEQDYKSEYERFPRLFDAIESVPGLTWPTQTFKGEMTIWLGSVEVQLKQVGRGHTKGDTIAWLPADKVLFSGDLVEFGATPYTGDAYLEDWPATIDNLVAMKPEKLVPGRGDALMSAEQCMIGLTETRAFISDMYGSVKTCQAKGMDLNSTYKATMEVLKPKYGHWVIFEHCLPFDVTRAYDECQGIRDPRIWTAERDKKMWQDLEG